MPNWPGLGYVAWIGLADKSKGDQVVMTVPMMKRTIIIICLAFDKQGGNLWAVKLGELPCDYTYASSTPITVSQYDKLQVFVQDGFELVKFKNLDAYTSCNLQQAETLATPTTTPFPSKVSDAFVEQADYPCRKDGVLNPWSCETINSPASAVEHNPINPGGAYTAKFPKAITLSLTADDAGKTLYFADKARCLTTKFQARLCESERALCFQRTALPDLIHFRICFRHPFSIRRSVWDAHTVARALCVSDAL
jgi:hypothetical protein